MKLPSLISIPPIVFTDTVQQPCNARSWSIFLSLGVSLLSGSRIEATMKGRNKICWQQSNLLRNRRPTLGFSFDPHFPPWVLRDQRERKNERLENTSSRFGGLQSRRSFVGGLGAEDPSLGCLRYQEILLCGVNYYRMYVFD